MPLFIALGWISGVVLGAVFGALFLTAFSFAPPGWLVLFLPSVTAWIAGIATASAALLTLVLIVLVYITGYMIATFALAPLILAVVSPSPVINLTSNFSPATTIALPPSNGEFFGRGLLIGFNACGNAILLSAIPIAGGFIAAWSFLIISLGTIIPVAANRIYQGFLGWSAWLFPVSYLATAVGALLFVINAIPAFAASGLNAFRVDWTTGVIETFGGITGITGFDGGFSLGNFTFITGVAVSAPSSFVAPGLSAHETGHSLNTAAMGGAVLWINAIDQNIFPRRLNLAYGELLAEGHSQAMPPPPMVPDIAVRLWL